MKGILINTEYELQVTPIRNGSRIITSGLVVNDNEDQTMAIVLGMQQGELKEDPLLGAGLTKFMRGKESKSEIEQRMRLHITRAGINYSNYKSRIALEIK